MQSPILDLVTADELHNELVRSVLKRRHPQVTDMEDWISKHSIESHVAYRNIKLPDGTMQMMAAVSVVSTPKNGSPTPPNPPEVGGKRDG